MRRADLQGAPVVRVGLRRGRSDHVPDVQDTLPGTFRFVTEGDDGTDRIEGTVVAA